MPKAKKEKNPETSGTAIAWVFTLNNPDEEEHEKLKQRFQNAFNDGTISYAVFQREVGEKTGTPHFQGYLHRK